MPQQWQLLCFTARFLAGLTTLLHPILHSGLQGSSAPHLHQHPLTCLLQLCLELLPLMVQTAAVILWFFFIPALLTLFLFLVVTVSRTQLLLSELVLPYALWQGSKPGQWV